MPPSTQAAATKLADVRRSCSTASLRQSACLLAVLLLGKIPLRRRPGGLQLGLLLRPHLGDLHAALDQLGLFLLDHAVVFLEPDLLDLAPLRQHGGALGLAEAVPGVEV